MTHNGAPVIAPIRGMTQHHFEARIWGVTETDLAGVTTQNGQKVDANYLRNNAQLESLSDGRYLVRLGRDFNRPIYAFRDEGYSGSSRQKVFVLDLRNVTPNPLRADPFALSGALP